MHSHTPSPSNKKHKRNVNYTPTYTPTLTHTQTHTHVHTQVHTHLPTQTPTIIPSHAHTHTEKSEIIEDEPEPSFTPPPMNLSIQSDINNNTIPPIPPMPEQMQYEQLYSSTITTTEDSSSTDGYVGFMFLLPMVILGAWFLQERVRRRHYDPIPDRDDDEDV